MNVTTVCVNGLCVEKKLQWTVICCAAKILAGETFGGQARFGACVLPTKPFAKKVIAVRVAFSLLPRSLAGCGVEE